MATDTKLNTLVLNVLTKEQYESLDKSDNELYLITDDSTYVEKSNLKTINGYSLIGSGNITIAGTVNLYNHYILLTMIINGETYKFYCNIVLQSGDSITTLEELQGALGMNQVVNYKNGVIVPQTDISIKIIHSIYLKIDTSETKMTMVYSTPFGTNTALGYATIDLSTELTSFTLKDNISAIA